MQRMCVKSKPYILFEYYSMTDERTDCPQMFQKNNYRNKNLKSTKRKCEPAKKKNRKLKRPEYKKQFHNGQTDRSVLLFRPN